MPMSASAPLTAPAPPPDRQAEQRVHEDEADQRSPEAPAQRTAGGEIVELVQLHLARVVPDGDHCVLKVDEVLLLQLAQLGPYFLGAELVVVGNDYQIAHEKIPLVPGLLVDRR